MAYFHGKSTYWKHWFRKPRNAIRMLRWSIWCVAGILFVVFLVLSQSSSIDSFETIIVGFCMTILGIEELLHWRKQLELKETIMQQVTSCNNANALDAIRIAAEKCWLYDGSFKGKKMWAANLQNAHLFRAIFQDVDLLHADLTSANLAAVDLRGATLWMTKLQKTNLIRADLEAADLLSADLQNANLSSANLTHSSLAEANLRGAILHKTRMHYTYLYRADLQGADFTDAEFQEVDLTEAVYDSSTIWPRDFEPPANAIFIAS